MWMNKEQAKQFWESLSSEQLLRAINFYEASPDGQYDQFTARCMWFLLHQYQVRN